jgi:hypothetical protein
MSSSLDIKQIYEALERSGYLMEQRVCPVIRRHGFIVTPNHVYEDQDTGKSREVDIHALYIEPIANQNDWDNHFTPTLIASCKNNHLPVVAFMHANSLHGVDVTNPIPKAGYPLEIFKKPDEINKINDIGKAEEFELKISDETTEIEEFLHFGEFHHFYRARYIASQYCRITELKQKQKKAPIYVADHGDLHDDLDSLVKAVEAEIASYKEASLRQAQELKPNTKDDDINFVIIYPVVIFSGEIYECRLTRSGAQLRPTNHVVFMRRVQSKTVKGEFYIDLIRESYLGRYLGTINRECKEIKKRLRQHHKILRESVAQHLRELNLRQLNPPKRAGTWGR